MVLNSPNESIGRDTNRVTLIGARDTVRLPVLTKREVAERILDHVLALRKATRPTADRRAPGRVAARRVVSRAAAPSRGRR